MTEAIDDVLLPGEKSVPRIEDMMELMSIQGGSDLLVSVGAPMKIKINGVLRMVNRKLVSADDATLMLTVLLDSDQLTTLDAKKELNVAISRPRIGRFRLSAFVQRGSLAFVMRFVPREIPHFDILGLPPILQELVMLKRGLLLVAGPTGSGKSTTLASLINLRNELCSDHILTIEDPIEFLFRHKKSVVNQRELGTDTLSAPEALRNALRQAPDVILIGEVRDQETMSMAMQYAQSGHLCLATLHANNAYHALYRIVSFYPPAQREGLYTDLASSLRAIVSQRLVRTLNGNRAPAVEVMMNTRGISELIGKGNIADIPERMNSGSVDGSQTFESVLTAMVRSKVITSAQALIHADSPTNLFWRLSQEGLQGDSQGALQAGVDRDRIPDVHAIPTSIVSAGMPVGLASSPGQERGVVPAAQVSNDPNPIPGSLAGVAPKPPARVGGSLFGGMKLEVDD